MKLTGCMGSRQQISKGVNKTALYYVEQIVTMDLFCLSYKPTFCYWLGVRTHSIPFVFCERSRPTNKRNREQKCITKKLASFITIPALSTKMELFIYFGHKRGTEIVSSNTSRNTKPIFYCNERNIYFGIRCTTYTNRYQ